MATNAELVTQLYVGYYDRAPDPEGLNYWIGRIEAGVSLADIANSFATSPEAIATYPFFSFPELVSAETFLKSVYLNLFGRAIDADGLAYYSEQLSSGTTPVGQILAQIIGNAATNEGSDDQKFLANKVAVGVDWATTAAGKAGFVFNDAAKSSAATVLDAVNATDASVTAAKATTAAFFSTVANPVLLTTGVDNLVGTAGNDKFIAVVNADTATSNTLSTADQIDGGAGKDTLAVTFDVAATTALPAATITNVENFEFRNVSGNALTVDFATITGEERVVSDRSTSAVTASSIAANTVVEVRGAVTSASSFGYVASATAASVVASGGTANGALTVTGTGLTSVTLSSENGANTLNGITLDTAVKAVTINAASNLTTGGISTVAADTVITVTGAGTVNLGTLTANVKEVNASANTAGVTVAGGIEAADKFTGGAGKDSVTLGTTVLTTGTIDGGAGEDTLVVSAGNTITSTTASKITNFEILSLGNGASAQTYDASLLTGLTGIVVGTQTFATTVDKLSAALAANITIAGSQTAGPVFNVTGASTVGQLDTLSLKIDDGLAAKNTLTVANITAAGVETVNIAATDNLTLSAATGLAAVTHLNVTGAGDVNITTGALAVNVNTIVDASAATGKFTFDASAATTNGLAIKGATAAVNVITGTNQSDVITGGDKGDTLNGGAGNDTIIGGAGDDTINGGAGNDTLTGGGGKDTFVIGNVTATGTDTITDFVAGTDKIKFVAATAVVDKGVLSSVTYATLADAVASFEVGNANETAASNAYVFTYGTDKYVLIDNGLNAGYLAGEDALVKITGLTGTLAIADFIA